MWLEYLWAMLMVSLGHVEQSTGAIGMMGTNESLLSWSLRDRMVKIATSVGRQALLTSLENDHTDLRFRGHLLLDGVVEDFLSRVQDQRLDFAFFGPDA